MEKQLMYGIIAGIVVLVAVAAFIGMGREVEYDEEQEEFVDVPIYEDDWYIEMPYEEEPFLEDEFCGWSTYGTCLTDDDCVTDGCSGEVCRSVEDEETMTPCIWLDCYDAEAYGLSCKCVEGTCGWFSE